jgi:uncharacterized phage-like protein YoqJ
VSRDDVKVLGVTGHRPKSLGLDEFNPKHPVWLDAYKFVASQIKFYDLERLVSGGALGFDMIAGKAAVEHDVPLELALPFEGYDSKWSDKDKRRLQWLIEHSVEHYYVCSPGYDPSKYQTRNERIVQRSDLLAACWDGSAGGTRNCLRAARAAKVPYHVHDPRFLADWTEQL